VTSVTNAPDDIPEHIAADLTQLHRMPVDVPLHRFLSAYPDA
jgi:hypothetical protein